MSIGSKLRSIFHIVLDLLANIVTLSDILVMQADGVDGLQAL